MTTLDQAALGRVATRVARWDGEQQSLNDMAFRRQTLTEIYEDLLFLHHTVKLSRPDAQIRRAKFYQGAVCTAGPTRHPDVPEYCIKFSSSRNCVACALFRRRNPESYPDHVPSNGSNTNTAFTSLANIPVTGTGTGMATTAATTTTEHTDQSKQQKPQAKRRRPAPAAMETESDSDGERKTTRVKPARRPPRDRSGSTPITDQQHSQQQQQHDPHMSDTHTHPYTYTHTHNLDAHVPYRISSHDYYDDSVSDPEQEQESEMAFELEQDMHDPLLSLCQVSKSPALSAITMEDAHSPAYGGPVFAGGGAGAGAGGGVAIAASSAPVFTNLAIPTRTPSSHGIGIGHLSPKPNSLILPPPFKLHRSMSATGSAPNSAPGSGTSSGATTARSNNNYSNDDADMEPALADVPPAPAQPGLLSPTLLGLPSRTSSASSSSRARSRSDATPEMLPSSGPWALPPTPPTQSGAAIPLTRARSQQPYDTYAVQLRNGLTMLIGVDARGGLHDPVIPSLAYSRAMSQDSGTAAAATTAASGNNPHPHPHPHPHHHPPHLTLPTTGSASPSPFASLSLSPSGAPLQSPTEAWFQAIAKQNDAISQSVGTAGPIPVEAALSDHILLSPALTGQAHASISPLHKSMSMGGFPASPLPLRLNTGMGGMGMDVDQIAVQLSKRVGTGPGTGTGTGTIGFGSNPSTPVLGPLAPQSQQSIDDHHTHPHFSQVKFSPSRLLPAH